jgi:hypothetical protein
VLELVPIEATVVRCCGEPAELGRLQPGDGCLAGSVARDELLLLGRPDTGARLLALAQAALSDDALVVDHSSAFSVTRLTGDDLPGAFARLSAIPLPETQPAFLQGLVADLPAKVFVLDCCLYLLVASVAGHVVEDRVRAACADLVPIFGAPTRFEALRREVTA